MGNDQCLARVISMGDFIYSFEINKGKENEAELKKSDEVLSSLLYGNSWVINNIFAKDGPKKIEIRKEIISRISFLDKLLKIIS